MSLHAYYDKFLKVSKDMLVLKAFLQHIMLAPEILYS